MNIEERQRIPAKAGIQSFMTISAIYYRRLLFLQSLLADCKHSIPPLTTALHLTTIMVK